MRPSTPWSGTAAPRRTSGRTTPGGGCPSPPAATTSCPGSGTPSTSCSTGSRRAAARERQFLADASHELRTPLSLMRTELEWVAHRPRSAAETATVLASMTGQVNRLVDLANALLDLEELRGEGPIPREDVVVAELVHDAVLAAVPSGEGVAVDADVAVVRVNRRWLELAVGNLVGNAAPARRGGRPRRGPRGRRPAAGRGARRGTRLPRGLRRRTPSSGSAGPSRAAPRPARGWASRWSAPSSQAHGGRAYVDPGTPACVRLDLPVG